MRRAIVLGSVLASFTVEQFSLDRLRDAHAPDEIRARYAEARRLAHFDDLEAAICFAGRGPRVDARSGAAATIARASGRDPPCASGSSPTSTPTSRRSPRSLAALERLPSGPGRLPGRRGGLRRERERVLRPRPQGRRGDAPREPRRRRGRADGLQPSTTTPRATRSTGPRRGIDPRPPRSGSASLPYTHRLEGVGLSHGNPIAPRAYEYVFAKEQAQELVPHLDALAGRDLRRPLAPLQGVRAPPRRRRARGGGVPLRPAPRLQVRGLGRLGGPAARLRQPGLLRHLRHRRAAWSSSTASPTTSSAPPRRSSTPTSRSTSGSGSSSGV